MEAQAKQLFDPIKDALNGLDPTGLLEVRIPVNAFKGHANRRVSIQKAIIDWSRATATTLEKQAQDNPANNGVGPVDIAGVPFAVTLIRHAQVIVPGRHFLIRHVAPSDDQFRVNRIKRAIDDKFPKLAGWKREHNAKTILVLEQADIQLTAPDPVMETFVEFAMAREDRPDETYLVVIFEDPPWLGYPILIGDETLHDLGGEYWEIDQTALTPVTKS
jgi:hypothetical protein